MAKIEENITIAASAEDIFDLLSDVERLADWMPGLVSVKRTSRRKRGVGVTTEVLAKAAGREVRGTGRCLAWERPRHLVVGTDFENGITATGTIDCSSKSAKSELDVRIEYEVPGEGVKRFVGGLVGDAMAKRDLKKALKNLKRRLEAGEE
jgi:uncharacterized membrane protein